MGKRIKQIINKLNTKQGFTLIELLAVIVILAILILLAMPSVLKIMENAKKNTFEIEKQSYLKAAQTQYLEKATTENITGVLHFQNGKNGNCTESSPCELDIDGGNMKSYDIYIKVDNNNIKQQSGFDNGSYYSCTGSCNRSGNTITVNKSDYNYENMNSTGVATANGK